MTLTPSAYTFLGLTAIVAALTATLTFAVLKFLSAARDTRAGRRDAGEAILSAALEEAVAKLKAQERATAARAEASERLSEEIIESLTAGLLVVALTGEIRILNPAARRMLNVPEGADVRRDYRQGVRRPAPAAGGGRRAPRLSAGAAAAGAVGGGRRIAGDARGDLAPDRAAHPRDGGRHIA